MNVDLFGMRPTRRAPRVLMHPTDTGSFPDGKDAATFNCRKCGHVTGWIYATRVEVRRGIPCSTCNGGAA